MNPELLQYAKNELETVWTKSLSEYQFSDISKTLTISCQHSDYKTLQKDVINGYIRSEYDNTVDYERKRHVLRSGTGELSGDTAIRIGYGHQDTLK